jgi:glycosyltransferase involved in cell wall biosynthesis
MRQPLITVLIDTYNYGHFIEEAIESVFAQDFPLAEVEVLVVDDGSTDDTAERVKRYGSRIQYFYKQNGGQGSAFNFGFASARGEIVALLDADDYWLPGKLRRVVEAFQNRPAAGMVYHRMMEINSETKESSEAPFVPLEGYLPDKLSDLLQYFPYPTSCIAFRRSLLQQVLPIPEKLRVQADGYLGATMVFAAPVLGLPDFLATYRIHGKNLYYDNEDAVPLERRRERLDARRVIIEGTRGWLSSHGHDMESMAVRAYLDRWKLYLESDEFLIEAPGRVKYFRHLMKYIRCYRGQMSARLRMINYVNAVGALVVGYKHFHLLDKWRLALSHGWERRGS